MWSEIKKAINSDFANEPLNTKTDRIETSTKINNTASSSGTLSQKLSYVISNLLGATNASDGSTTAGTAMAKLNALLTSWTSARASYVDSIYTNASVNNTASSTGILSQKMSYIINNMSTKLRTAAIQTGSLASDGTITVTIPGGCVLKTVSAYDGSYGSSTKYGYLKLNAVTLDGVSLDVRSIFQGNYGGDGLKMGEAGCGTVFIVDIPIKTNMTITFAGACSGYSYCSAGKYFVLYENQ